MVSMKVVSFFIILDLEKKTIAKFLRYFQSVNVHLSVLAVEIFFSDLSAITVSLDFYFKLIMMIFLDNHLTERI